MEFSTNTKPIQFVVKRIVLYVVLVVGAAIMISPLLWIFFACFKTLSEITAYPPKFLPGDFLNFRNFIEVFASLNFFHYFLNSILVGGISTVSVLFFSAMAGYVFGKFEFPGRNALFLVVLSTLLIPWAVKMIPLYLLASAIGITDSYIGLLFPTMVTAFGIFMMRQFVASVPDELIDAARIDGCPEFKIFVQITLPLLRPALGALAIFQFMWNWDWFLWPLVVVSSDKYKTLPLALTMFNEELFARYDLTLTAASLTILPVILVFIFAEKQMIEGITLSGLKM